jgi:hypothetical protein
MRSGFERHARMIEFVRRHLTTGVALAQYRQRRVAVRRVD